MNETRNAKGTNMTTIETRNGSWIVRTIEQQSTYSSRLYVNNGETATLTHATHSTKAGAIRWANKQLARK